VIDFKQDNIPGQQHTAKREDRSSPSRAWIARPLCLSKDLQARRAPSGSGLRCQNHGLSSASPRQWSGASRNSEMSRSGFPGGPQGAIGLFSLYRVFHNEASHQAFS
jgi:hypothetical protein